MMWKTAYLLSTTLLIASVSAMQLLQKNDTGAHQPFATQPLTPQSSSHAPSARVFTLSGSEMGTQYHTQRWVF